MHDQEQIMQKAVLVGVDTGDYNAEYSIDELEELARTAGAQVLAKVIQKREKPDTATYIGAGRLEEIKEFCAHNEANLLIFDSELSPTQMRNIEEETELAVVDRTTLILDIFAQRAHSSEGKLQVELAQLEYRLPRLTGFGGQLSRLGGGIGTRGPGESKLESDRRHIRRRITHLKQELAGLEKRRSQRRARRKKDDVLTAAIVGYTNVGKSTLLNALTGAGVLAENKLFATLDPTTRMLELPGGTSVLLVDTVGLISRLPHNLVEAFQSTLEEAAAADLILHVCDLSNESMEKQQQVTERLLADLGCQETPVVTIYNKSDMEGAFVPLVHGENACVVSAKTGAGFEEMLRKIEAALPARTKRLRLLLPYAKSNLEAVLRESSKILDLSYTDGGILIDALVDIKTCHLVEEYAV